jgi:hypothetical protein
MQTTFGGEWRESHERRVSLPETKVADFEVYLEWLYTGQVVTLDKMKDLGPTLLRLYVLGDFLVDDRFCNAVIDSLIRESSSRWPFLRFWPADINSAWDKTMPGSRLRKVLIDLMIRDLSGEMTAPCFRGKGTWCHAVTAEILSRMAENKQVAVKMFTVLAEQVEMRQSMSSAVEHPRDNKNKCADYHKHGEGYPACT